MSYSADREAFVYRMATCGVPLYDLRIVLRSAGVCQRAAVVDCSVRNETIRDASERANIRAEGAILEALKGSGWRPTFRGDPRGYVVHLLHRDHNEVAVPAQGYRASQLDRMNR